MNAEGASALLFDAPPLDIAEVLPMMRTADDEVRAAHPDVAVLAEMGDRDAAAELGRLKRHCVMAMAVRGVIDTDLNNLLGSKE